MPQWAERHSPNSDIGESRRPHCVDLGTGGAVRCAVPPAPGTGANGRQCRATKAPRFVRRLRHPHLHDR
eukprot:214486-Alexandrium_andersonii.AAC.1